MTDNRLQPSELVLNPDGSVYHLALKDEHIADNVIIVGDQGRVGKVSKYFDRIDFEIQNREFKTHTGTFQGKRISVMSTGIGTDNIDIFINELDAAVNIDLEEKVLKSSKRKLNIIRIGTTGALHEDIKVGSHIISAYGLGLDGLLHFYEHNNSDDETQLLSRINNQLHWHEDLPSLYLVKASDDLFDQLKEDMTIGITATAPGFYAPQGRRLLLNPKHAKNIEILQGFQHKDLRITNFEMETSAFYGLGKMLGHNCCTCCVALANRATGKFVKDHSSVVEGLIETVLERLVTLS